MKAIVLAGGYATRLWPVTRHRPKMFLPVGDSTVIDRVFEELEADDRVSEVFVSTNARFAEDFESYLDDHDWAKPTLSVEGTTGEEEKPGVVGALAELVDRENVEEDVVVVAGDNLISFDVAEFVDFFETKEAPCLAAYDVGSREKAKSYGLVTLDGDRVVDFQEKPSDPASTLVSIACYAFPAGTLDLLDRYLAEDNNPDEPGWFLQWLQARESTYAFTFQGAWFDIGTADSYLDAVAWHLDGDSLVAEDAIVENTTVGPNVHVMSGAELRDARVESAVVFPGATIEDATLDSTVVDENARVSGVDLAGSLVGAYSQVVDGD